MTGNPPEVDSPVDPLSPLPHTMVRCGAEREGDGEMEFVEVQRVDEVVLQAIVERILQVVHPVQVVLFGSYATGHPSPDSDLDLLIVVDRLTSSRRNLRLKIRRALRPFLIPKDIVVVTAEEVEAWKHVPQAFLTTILQNGKILYERKTQPGEGMA